MAALTFDDVEDIQPQKKSRVLTFDDVPDAPQTDMVRQGYRGVMNNVARPINEAVSGAIGYAVNKLGSATPEGKQAAGTAINYIKNSPVGVAIGKRYQQAKDEINDLSQYNSDLKDDLSAFGQNAQLAANTPLLKPLASVGVMAAQKIEPILAKAPGVLGNTGSGVSVNAALGNVPNTAANITKAGVTSTPELADVASHFYSTAEQTGGLLKPEAVQRVAAGIKGKVLKSTPEGQIFGGNTIVDDYLTRLDKISSMPVSLKGLDEIDTSLQNAIGAASRTGDKTAVSGLKEIQNGLRNASATANPGDIVNPQAFQAWRDGDTVYAAKMKSQQIDDIVKNAYNQQVPSTGIKTGFRQLAKSIDKYGKQGWTDTEIEAIRKAAKSGIVGGAFGTMGGKLMSGIAGTVGGAGAGIAGGGIMGAALGAPVGLAVGEAAGFPMRAAANTLQRARATQVQRLLGDRQAVAGLTDKAKLELAKAEFAARKAKLKP